ncbi:protein terminal ear1 homolog isoform X1 [Manihot esculenta]|uniref:Mei2-like C-terminal RNA recognition motif domain-containing protein n=1 Tax=Manihot esculenta TaxID=3983 RepID=A0A2C9W0T8_MANES|nr:protein terminal ear1 homolog isoform X1 [Manihot esculenta]
MVAQSGLNPEAPEYVPNYCNPQIAQVVYCVNNLPRSSPIFSTNPLYYASVVPSNYVCYAGSSHPTNQQPMVIGPPAGPSSVAQTERTREPQLEPGPEAVTEVISPRDAKGECSRNRRGRCFINGRENQRKTCRARGDSGRNYNFRRHARAPAAASRQNRPVLPIRPEEHTTVMIRNIPNRYTRELLMEFLDKHCMVENQKAMLRKSDCEETFVSAFDFLYLPMDFGNHANKGYAFVNFTDSRAAWKFHAAVHNQRWELFQSTKICEIASARLQGKEGLVKHFRNSTFECGTDDYLPVCFSPPRDGSRVIVKQTIIGKRVGKC